MIPKFRFWFEDEKGNYVMGEGLYLLLKNISIFENLSKAVNELNMSYRNGWGKIREVEERLGKKIIETKRGGSPRGETKLTDFGKELMETYEKYNDVLSYYIKRPYKVPSIAVDGVLIESNKILLIKRKNDPFKDKYALPGGFVEYGETVEEAITREIREEISIEIRILSIVGIYSSPDRDPRGHTISIAYLIEKIEGTPKAGDDASEIRLFNLNKLPDLAFDHGLIIKDALKNMKII
ncbi:MAG: NUDIX domain-containing protein [Thermoplasmata archaeon]